MSGAAQVRWVSRLWFQSPSPSLSPNAVTCHSAFLFLIYRITLTRFVTQIRILWQWPQGLKVVFAKHWLVPPLLLPPPFSPFSLFSPLYRGPKPAKHIYKWQLLRPASKRPRDVDFPRLMWHHWPRSRMEGERWGPGAQWRFVWGTAWMGSRIRMWRTLAVSRLIQHHWFLASFFLPPGHDLHCKW